MKKQTQAQNQQQQQPLLVLPDHRDIDRRLFDIVLASLYENADKDTLHMEDDILKPLNINLPPNEADRIWEVMVSSGLVSPVVGFGNAGKLELTKSGYQLLSQYGTYSQYLQFINEHNKGR
jgi:hypothetical protein